jgi:hypothetical protein
MLKLYFWTQSIRTLTYFDLSWSSSSSYLTCLQLVLCANIRVIFVIIIDFGCFLYFTISGVILACFSPKHGDVMSLVLVSYRLRYWSANICLAKGEIFKSFILGLTSYSIRTASSLQKKKTFLLTCPWKFYYFLLALSDCFLQTDMRTDK